MNIKQFDFLNVNMKISTERESRTPPPPIIARGIVQLRQVVKFCTHSEHVPATDNTNRFKFLFNIHMGFSKSRIPNQEMNKWW